ncbi:TIGR02680 family protein [Kineosporia succinea]|uniref:Uncharacterized protein (TIGR02680 family) n=1 Tax=Kineosporia succinea TaxID=84632 RepID=A0ABT9P8I7_9ACTN|nr:TIGR02680 family protein [Kineosporia succinea]MDP9829015.1 uncharacterized protein (TIGR02680 family) [Kineosporia succinea]
MTVQDQHRHRPERGEPERWSPSRAGILNVWRYYDEVFEFHHGRLLIRGPNGSGKSKALELLLPFVFDANLRASRLSTFGTGDRAMHWNMMGEGTGGAVTRVGYVWLELRLGSDTWFTCGARLSATTRTSSVKSDWFTTDQRVGHDLHLLNDAGQPLTRKSLEEAVHSRGAVHANAGEYRDALRARLFCGLNEGRYEAMISALLQLRTPKLSQRLDPGLLSDLLSAALPPLDEGDIAELAEGFERLDRQREEVKELDGIVTAAATVARQAQTYSRRVLRAYAADLISATTSLDTASQSARDSQADYDQVKARITEIQQQIETLNEQIPAYEARIEGLTSSDAYREGRELDGLRRRAEQAQERATRLSAHSEQARDELLDLQEQTQSQEEILRSATQELERDRAGLIRAAERVDMSARTPADGLEVDALAARNLIALSVRERRQEISQIRSALSTKRDAVHRREQTEKVKDEAVTGRQSALGTLEAAKEALETAIEQQAERLIVWASACILLPIPIEPLGAAAAEEREVQVLVSQARDQVVQGISDERSELQHRHRQARSEHESVRADLERTQSEVHLPPTPPHTRTAARQNRPGAPLWQLITFRPHIPEPEQAGIEAALEASGLLDAWVAPDGKSLAIDGHDVFAQGARPAVDGPSLRDVLIPEIAPAVPPAAVNELLAAVAYGSTLPPRGESAIGADGSWRLSALHGTWSKPEAGYIGATARERARRLRITQLQRQLQALDALLQELQEALDLLQERDQRLAEEIRSRPDFRAVDDASGKVLRAQADASAAERLLASAQEHLKASEVAAREALQALMNLAAEHRLPADESTLSAVEAALGDFLTAAGTWASAHQRTKAATGVVKFVIAQRTRAERAAGQADQEATAARADALSLSNQLQAVQDAIGSTYEQILADVSATRSQRSAAEKERDKQVSTRLDLTRKEGELRTARLRDADHHRQTLTVRNQAADAVLALLGGYLPQDAGLELDLGERDGSRAALEAARAIAAAWPTVPHEQRLITLAQSKLMETLHAEQDILARRADLELATENDVAVLNASIGGLRMSAAALLHRLRTELQSSQDDITGAEHQLFERTLTGDTRRHLAARIRQAEELVHSMNERLAMVRTASSVAVRLTWQIDPQLPDGTRAARELLLKDPVRLSEQDREALHVFFR